MESKLGARVVDGDRWPRASARWAVAGEQQGSSTRGAQSVHRRQLVHCEIVSGARMLDALRVRTTVAMVASGDAKRAMQMAVA